MKHNHWQNAFLILHNIHMTFVYFVFPTFQNNKKLQKQSSKLSLQKNMKTDNFSKKVSLRLSNIRFIRDWLILKIFYEFWFLQQYYYYSFLLYTIFYFYKVKHIIYIFHQFSIYSTMDTLKKIMMQQLIKILAPTSPAYGNGSNMPFVKEESLPEIIDQLETGDIIFTKTNNSIYQLGRSFLQTEYDHVSVVINKNQVIHISPPIISKLQIAKIVQKSREPFIVRLNFQDNCDQMTAKERKDLFLIILHNYLGEKYNEIAIPSMFKNQFANRIEKVIMSMLSLDEKSKKDKFEFNSQILKYSKICSEAVFYALYKAHPNFCGNIEAYVNAETNYKSIGFIMPSQLKNFLGQKQIQIIYNGSQKSITNKTLVDHFKNYQASVSDTIYPLSSFLKTYLETGTSLIIQAFKKTYQFSNSRILVISQDKFLLKKYLPIIAYEILSIYLNPVKNPKIRLLFLFMNLVYNIDNGKDKKVKQIMKLLIDLLLVEGLKMKLSARSKL